jgi:Protein of unknown function, DUF261
MIKQTNPALRKEIRLYGCNFLSHLYLLRQDWSEDEVEEIYQKAIKAGIMNGNCFLSKPQELLKLIGTSLRQIGGQNLTGKKDSWGVVLPSSRIKFAIVRWTQKNSKHQHFTVFCVNEGGELYDPYCPDEATYSLEKCTKLSEQYYG